MATWDLKSPAQVGERRKLVTLLSVSRKAWQPTRHWHKIYGPVNGPLLGDAAAHGFSDGEAFGSEDPESLTGSAPL